MSWSQIQRMEFIRYVEQILHLPGNDSGKVLEMAVVLDCTVSKEELQETLNFIVPTLKQHSEVFRNVRLNVIEWGSDDCIQLEVSSMGMLLTGNCFHELNEITERKSVERLTAYLKLFAARCRFILVLTNGKFEVGNKEKLEANMKPFVFRKLVWMLGDENAKGFVQELIPCPPYRIMIPLN